MSRETGYYKRTFEFLTFHKSLHIWLRFYKPASVHRATKPEKIKNLVYCLKKTISKKRQKKLFRKRIESFKGSGIKCLPYTLQSSVSHPCFLCGKGWNHPLLLCTHPWVLRRTQTHISWLPKLISYFSQSRTNCVLESKSFLLFSKKKCYLILRFLLFLQRVCCGLINSSWTRTRPCEWTKGSGIRAPSRRCPLDKSVNFPILVASRLPLLQNVGILGGLFENSSMLILVMLLSV